MKNYEKKYKDLVKAVKELQEANPSDEGIQNWVNENVPELAESEDERIRKEIIRVFKGGISFTSEKENEKYIAWLEKQKPDEWSEEDEYNFAFIQEALLGLDGDDSYREKCCKMAEWITSLKDRVQPQSKQEWVEDEKIGKELIDFCIKYSQGSTVVNSQNDFTRWTTWLKSLKDRYTWKPTKQQLTELRCVISGCSFETSILVELEENLKKLKG